MGKKGDRAYKEPMAKDYYALGELTLQDIALILDISVTSLCRWKHATKDPHQQEDEWDRARLAAASPECMLNESYKKKLAYYAALSADEMTARETNALKGLRRIILDEKEFELKRVKELRVFAKESLQQLREEATGVADEVVTQVKKAGLTNETADEIRQKILGIGA